jgi:hypothetical protein
VCLHAARLYTISLPNGIAFADNGKDIHELADTTTNNISAFDDGGFTGPNRGV